METSSVGGCRACPVLPTASCSWFPTGPTVRQNSTCHSSFPTLLRKVIEEMVVKAHKDAKAGGERGEQKRRCPSLCAAITLACPEGGQENRKGGGGARCF